MLSVATATPRPASGKLFTRVLVVEGWVSRDVVRAGYCAAENAGGSADRDDTYLIAPAAVLGPNHCPTSFPRSLPTRAMRWTLNGQSGEGVSRNQVMICTYIA